MEKVVTVPGSKSIAARALILARVYGLRDLKLENLPDCDDTRELLTALRMFDADMTAAKTGQKSGSEKAGQESGSKNPRHRYMLGNGGTSLRFFTALAASSSGFEGIVDCGAGLRKRPLRQLIDALRQAGAEIQSLECEGEAPLYIKGKTLDGTGVEVDGSVSSQFASALAMVSPLWHNPVEMPRTLVSRPYLEMTLRMRELFSRMTCHASYFIEGDWSAASYFYEWALLNPGKEVYISGLTVPSLQGDSACAELFAAAGVRTEYTQNGVRIRGNDLRRDAAVRFDMSNVPDLVPALAVGLAVAGIPFVMHGVANLRYKESDRIGALQQELGRMGRRLLYSEQEDTLHMTENQGIKAYGDVEFDSHDDHRIAMALAAAGVSPQKIRGKDCVAKSFPGFFSQLFNLNSD